MTENTTPMMLVARYGPRGGRGFGPIKGPDETEEPWVWAFTSRLINDETLQLPQLIAETPPHPVWSLQTVRVRGDLWWCFIVRGRRSGPGFGNTGGCHFGFVQVTEASGLDAWRLARTVVAQQEPAPLPDRSVQESTRNLLAGLTLDAPIIRIGDEPAVAAKAIEAALTVVPHDVAIAHTWSTCVFQVSELTGQKVVAAGWPRDFEQADRQLWRQIEQSLGAVENYTDQLAASDTQLRRGLDGVVDDAFTRDSFTRKAVREQAITTMTQLIRYVHSETAIIDPADVPDHWYDGEKRSRLNKRPGAVTAFVRTQSKRALVLLQTDGYKGDPASEAAWAGLVEQQINRPNENVFDLGARAKQPPDGWAAEVGEHIFAYCSDHELDWSAVIGMLANGVLKAPTDFVLATPVWWGSGYRPNDKQTTAFLKHRLSAGLVDEGVQYALGWLKSPLHDVKVIVPSIPLLGPPAAAKLLTATVTNDQDKSTPDLTALCRTFVDRAISSSRDPRTWVLAFHHAVEAEASPDWLAQVVLDALGQHRPDLIAPPATEHDQPDLHIPARSQPTPVATPTRPPSRSPAKGKPYQPPAKAKGAAKAPPGHKTTSGPDDDPERKRVVTVVGGIVVVGLILGIFTYVLGFSANSSTGVPNPVTQSSAATSPSPTPASSTTPSPTATITPGTVVFEHTIPLAATDTATTVADLIDAYAHRFVTHGEFTVDVQITWYDTTLAMAKQQAARVREGLLDRPGWGSVNIAATGAQGDHRQVTVQYLAR
jgi:hypothetical protein